jgi:hypothetical protein
MATMKSRRTNKTVLFAVEGDTDQAFLRHIRNCYVGRDMNVSLTVKNAHGAGPLGIVDALKSGARGKSFDFFAGLLDSDIQLCRESRSYFNANSVRLFQSVPAIEGTLLKLANVRLQENITTDECKRLLAAQFNGDSMDVRFYERHFDKVMLEANRSRLLLVDELIKYLIAPD